MSFDSSGVETSSAYTVCVEESGEIPMVVRVLALMMWLLACAGSQRPAPIQQEAPLTLGVLMNPLLQTYEPTCSSAAPATVGNGHLTEIHLPPQIAPSRVIRVSVNERVEEDAFARTCYTRVQQRVARTVYVPTSFAPRAIRVVPLVRPESSTGGPIIALNRPEPVSLVIDGREITLNIRCFRAAGQPQVCEYVIP